MKYLLLFLTTTLGAQTWYVVPAAQSINVSVTMPTGTTYQFCSTNNKCSIPVTTTAITSVVNFADGLNGRPSDPDSGFSKTLQVQEQVSSYSITVNDSSVKPTKITIIPVPPIPAPTVTATYTNCTCQLFSDGSFTCTVPSK